MNIEEIRKNAPVLADSYYIDGDNVLYFERNEENDCLFLFIDSLNDFFLIDDFPVDKLKPL